MQQKWRQPEEQRPSGDRALFERRGHSSAEYSGQRTAAVDSQRRNRKHPESMSECHLFHNGLFGDVSREISEVSGDGEGCNFFCGGVICSF